MATHSGHKPFKCHLCPKGFVQKRYLQSHLKLHEEKPALECSKCDQMFHNENERKSHLRLTHGEYKKYECSVCGKETASQSSLVIHMRQHTGKYFTESLYTKLRSE